MSIVDEAFEEKQSSTYQQKKGGTLTYGKSLAKVYGWMGLGLLITGLVAFFVSFILIKTIGPAVTKANPTEAEIQAAAKALTTYLIILAISGISLLILNFIMWILMAKQSKHLLVPYIIYTALFGVVLSTLLIAGIDFYVIGEAFLITSAVFIVMALIGWFSKVNLNWLGLALLALLFSTLLIGGVFLLISLISGNPFMYYAVDFGISMIVLVVVILVVAIDSYNMKKTFEAGVSGRAIELTFAFTMYLDFIRIFIRILALLAKLKKR